MDVPMHPATATEKGTFMNELDHFQEAAKNPEGYGKNLKASGRPVIGCLCSYAPEELIHAAGAHPMRLFGTKEAIVNADGHLQTYCCSLAKGVLENTLTGRLSFLDGAVFPHTCDTIQRLSDIWRLNTDYDFFADVVYPVKLNTQSALDYTVDIFERFKKNLESWSGQSLSEADLTRSIEIFNSIRDQLAEIYRMRSKDPACLSGSLLSSVVKGSMILDRDELPERLFRLRKEIEEGRYAVPGNERKKRLIVAGSLCDHPNFFSILEESDGVVVWDDLCTGSRYFDETVDIGVPPLEAIARRYVERRRPCPAKHLSNTARGEALAAMAEEHKASGVIFFLLKFCDPHAFDYPYLKEYLETRNVSVTLVEVENQLPPEGQLKTRLETFIHML